MNIQREKLLEALRLFSTRVQRPGAIKLLKLLFYLDLIHFRQTGRSVTGLQYEAWPFGPVARPVWEGLKDPSSELQQHFSVHESRLVDTPKPRDYELPLGAAPSDIEPSEYGAAPSSYRVPTGIKPKHEFKHYFLSQREIEIAEQLAEMFRDATADQMSEASHNRGGPWHLALTRKSAFIDLLEGRVDIGDSAAQLSPEEIRELGQERLSPEA